MRAAFAFYDGYSRCHVGCQCTSKLVVPDWCVIGWMCFGWNPSLVHAFICFCVSISGLNCVTTYVVWLFKCMWSCISMTSYDVSIVSLGVM